MEITKCRNCTINNYCNFHMSNGVVKNMLRTNLSYTKTYTVINIFNLEISEMKMTDADRSKAIEVAEVSKAIATCSYCYRFRTCTVYTRYEYRESNTKKQICVDCTNTNVITVREILDQLYPDKKEIARVVSYR